MLITLRNVLRRPRRTILTAAGVAVGAATYMVLLTAGRGLLEQFSESAKILGAEVVVQQKGVTSPWNSVVPPDIPEKVARLPHVSRVSSMVLGKTRFLGASYFLVFGVGAADPILSGLPLLDGKLMTPSATHNEMLVGSRAAERFELATGDRIEARNMRFEVIGVYETGRAVLDNGAIMDLPVAQTVFNISDGANLLFLDLDDPDRIETVAEEINRRFPEVESHPTSGWVESYGQVTMIRTFSRFLALIALVIAMLGVSNVMHISVSERTKELAILRAIGWSRWRVASLVLFEGTTLSLLGGLFGIPLGAAVLFIVGSIDAVGYSTAGLIPLGLTLGAAVEGVLVCSLAGAFGSLTPLIRALRLQPAQALRSL
jgi:putative ABC transport system permease protein